MTVGFSDILGINRRNREFLYPLNDRKWIFLANDKIETRRLLEAEGLPMPELVEVVGTVGLIRRSLERVKRYPAPVAVKPARGSGGRGVLFLRKDPNGAFIRGDGTPVPEETLRFHFCAILAGEFSLRAGMDQVVVERMVQTDRRLLSLSPLGAPDLRVLLHCGEPIAAMARIPTALSEGRANLHQGAIGVGLDLDTGSGIQAVWMNRIVTEHPDTLRSVRSLQVPYWREILGLSKKAVRVLPLGYAGIDIMVDREHGPLIIEVNAHPGLGIQLANGAGIVSLLKWRKSATTEPGEVNR